MNTPQISESIRYVGVDDNDLDLFESQYIVPNGISYNSYIIIDEKVAIMDTVDERKADEWLANVQAALGSRKPDYVVVHHMEPDHTGSLARLAELYPDMQIVGNSKTFAFMRQFYGNISDGREVVVAEGDTLALGSHTLSFVMAPMVHWPEAMVSFEASEGVFFSADAFGKFGALTAEEGWDCEARRYYMNICGKYGAQVQALLKKASALDIKTICPLHGPILSGDLSHYIGLYDKWSKYEAETPGVFVAYASIHGNTAKAAHEFAAKLVELGVERIEVADLSRDDMAECIENAFRYTTTVLAGASYDAGVFPCMDDFLHHLKNKNFCNRKIAIIENGSWAPTAARTMKAALETMKNIELFPNTVTIKSALDDNSRAALMALATEVASNYK